MPHFVFSAKNPHYLAEAQADEEQLITERDKIRAEQSIPDGVFYHFDTPFTIEHQIDLFLQSGFACADKV